MEDPIFRPTDDDHSESMDQKLNQINQFMDVIDNECHHNSIIT